MLPLVEQNIAAMSEEQSEVPVMHYCVKAFASVLFACLLAGGIAIAGTRLAMSGDNATTSRPAVTTPDASTSQPAAKVKFETPVWHPDARWERAGNWGGTGIRSNLDGPRQEVMWRSSGLPATHLNVGSPEVLMGYDASSERIHAIAFSGRGYLDGPFSRARYGGGDYGARPTARGTPDGRYYILTDPYNGGAIRLLDFKEQMVRTILPDMKGAQAMTFDSKGQLWILLAQGRLVTIDMDTLKTVTDITLKATDGIHLGFGASIALDEKRNRLYASGKMFEGKDGKKWHVWYFHLADGGSFHGVLAGEYFFGFTVGAFDTYKGYGESSINFGPDDPEKRFLYMRITDCGTFARLDLERRMVAGCSGPPKGQKGPVMFVEQGSVNGTVPHCGPLWLPDGSFVMPGRRQEPAPFFRRVK